MSEMGRLCGRYWVRRPQPTTKVQNNPEFCGFVCSACNFRLRLSDPVVSEAVVELFKHGEEYASLACTECGREHAYSRGDLQMFLPGGRQTPLRKERPRRTA